MKHNYKLIIIALAGIVLTYAGCSKLKDDGNANTSTVSTKVVNAQMASTLSEALYGSEAVSVFLMDWITQPILILK